MTADLVDRQPLRTALGFILWGGLLIFADLDLFEAAESWRTSTKAVFAVFVIVGGIFSVLILLTSGRAILSLPAPFAIAYVVVTLAVAVHVLVSIRRTQRALGE